MTFNSTPGEPRTEAARREFAERYGRHPSWVVAAPGRVNLIGEHTDYNDGFVLPMAIGRGILAAFAPAVAATGANRIRVHSLAVGASDDIPLDTQPPVGGGDWRDYVRGVIHGFRDRAGAIPALDILLASDLPLGGGLSSSAALEVAIATVLETATGHRLAQHDKALLCQRAEHEYAGVPCGLMDQLAVTLGDGSGPIFIDTRSGSTRTVPLGAGVVIVVANTGVRHSHAGGEYARRRAECVLAARQLGVPSLRDATPDLLAANQARLDPTAARRARHVVHENERTLRAVAALERGDHGDVGRLFYESHASLRDDFEVSCAELDAVVDTAIELGPRAGVFGARMTGGGFGGCAIALVTETLAADVVAQLAIGFERRTGRALDAFVTAPVPGARVIAGAVEAS